LISPLNEPIIKDIIEYSNYLIGVPYVWNTENASYGYDCSGGIRELLSSVGACPKYDLSSQGYFNYYSKYGDRQIGGPGSLLFYGDDEDSVEHIAIQVSSYQLWEVAGGNRKTTSPDKAALIFGAMARRRPLSSRNNIIASIMPDYFTLIKETVNQ